MASQMVSLYMMQLQQNAARQESEIARTERREEMDTAQINQAFQMSIQSTNDFFKAQQALDNRDLELMREKHKWDMAERKDIREQEEHALAQKVKFAEHREKEVSRADRFTKSEARKERGSKRHARAVTDTTEGRVLRTNQQNALRQKSATLKQIRDTIKQLEKMEPHTYKMGAQSKRMGAQMKTKNTRILEQRLKELKSLEQQATVLDPLDHVQTIAQAGHLSGQVPGLYNLESEIGVRLTQPPPLIGAGAPFTELQPPGPWQMAPGTPPEEGEEDYGYEEHY